MGIGVGSGVGVGSGTGVGSGSGVGSGNGIGIPFGAGTGIGAGPFSIGGAGALCRFSGPWPAQSTIGAVSSMRSRSMGRLNPSSVQTSRPAGTGTPRALVKPGPVLFCQSGSILTRFAGCPAIFGRLDNDCGYQ